MGSVSFVREQRTRATLRATPLHLALRAGVLMMALAPADASAHSGAPRDAWRAWQVDPAIAVGLVVAGWLYARGTAVLWARAGRGRGVKRWQAGCFWAGLGVVAIALFSPLDSLGSALFSFHMVQHLLLTLAAPPLLVLGGVLPWLWAPPAAVRRRLIRESRRAPFRRTMAFLLNPMVAAGVHAVAIWTWHVPMFYQAALDHDSLHALEHVSFLGSGLLLWWAATRARGLREWRYPVAFLALFATAVQSGALGALLTFSGKTWYPAHQLGPIDWGLTPLEDQQIAGTLMWVPPGLVYLVAALALLAAWIDNADEHARKPVAAPGRFGDREGWASR